MCGISGFWQRPGVSAEKLAETVRAMSDTLRQCGPGVTDEVDVAPRLEVEHEVLEEETGITVIALKLRPYSGST